MEAKPSLAGVGAAVLYRTLGPTLPEGCAEGAALWFVAQRCAGAYPEAVRRAGIEPNGAGLGDALFDKVIASDDGVVFTSHLHEEAWDLLGSADNKIHANIPQLVEMLQALPDAPAGHTTAEFPLVLSAGERRSSTANTIFRDPGWRKADQEGALAMSSADAAAHGLVDGDRVRLLTAAGSAEPTCVSTTPCSPAISAFPTVWASTTPTRTASTSALAYPPTSSPRSAGRTRSRSRRGTSMSPPASSR